MMRFVMIRAAFLILLLISSSASASSSGGGSGKDPVMFGKWWPMCIFAASATGAINSEIQKMRAMAAKCKVDIEVYTFPIPQGSAGRGVDSLKEALRDKCNLTFGFKKFGVNRASILTLLGDSNKAREMCAAQGEKDIESCGEMGYDPGESFQLRMNSAGYWGGFAPKGQPAVSFVGPGAMNAKDMSAVALGQGMMSLPPGYEAGNGVGGDFEGELGGGAGAGEGWTEWGCQQMRNAAFDNSTRRAKYVADMDKFLPMDRKLKMMDPFDGKRIFGNNGGGGGSEEPQGGGAPPRFATTPPPAQSTGASTSLSSTTSFFGTASAAPASQASAAPSLHRQESGEVTSLRRNEVEPPPKSDVRPPSNGPGVKSNRLVWDEQATPLTDKEQEKLAKKTPGEQGAEGAQAGAQAGAEKAGEAKEGPSVFDGLQEKSEEGPQSRLASSATAVEPPPGSPKPGPGGGASAAVDAAGAKTGATSGPVATGSGSAPAAGGQTLGVGAGAAGTIGALVGGGAMPGAPGAAGAPGGAADGAKGGPKRSPSSLSDGFFGEITLDDGYGAKEKKDSRKELAVGPSRESEGRDSTEPTDTSRRRSDSRGSTDAYGGKTSDVVSRRQ